MSRNRSAGPTGKDTRGRKEAATEARGPSGGLGAAALDNPVATGGSLVMALTASLIVANATFFQTTRHPAPLVETRESLGPDTGERRAAPDPALLRQQKLVLDVQLELRRLGMYEGSLDGLSGPATERAVRAWERARGLPETGHVDDRLLGRLALDQGNALYGVPVPPPSPVHDGASGASPAASAGGPPASTPSGVRAPVPATPGGRPASITDLISRETGVPLPPRDVGVSSPERERVRKIQAGLSELGYGPISVDGLMGEQTANAVRRFELDRGLAITGEITDTLSREIDRALRR